MTSYSLSRKEIIKGYNAIINGRYKEWFSKIQPVEKRCNASEQLILYKVKELLDELDGRKEIVCCEDCKFSLSYPNLNNTFSPYCIKHKRYVLGGEFCNYGERE